MNYLRQNKNKIIVIAIINMILTATLVIGFYHYMRYRDRSAYEQNVADLQSISKLYSDVTDAEIDSRNYALSNIVRYQNSRKNPLTLEGLVEFIDTYYESDQYQFQILSDSYKGYYANHREDHGVTSFDPSNYELDYTDKRYSSLQGACDHILEKYSQGSVAFATGRYTDITAGEECFAYYDTIKVTSSIPGRYDYYTIIEIVYGDVCKDIVENYDSYESLKSAVIDGHGKIIIANNYLEGYDNFYTRISDLNGISKNEIEDIRQEIKQNKGGIYIWNDEDGEERIYSIEKMQNLGWYMVVSTETNEFIAVNSERYTYTLLITLLALFFIDVTALWVVNRQLISAVRSELNANDELRDIQVELERIKEGQAIQIETFERSIPGGFKISKSDGTIMYISPKLAETAGYTVAEFLQETKGVMDGIMHPNDVAYSKAKIEEGLKYDESYTVKYRLRCKDGEYIWVVENGKFVLEEGQLYYYSVIIDFNDSEEKAIALREANARVSRERRQYRDALIRNAEFYYEVDITENNVVSPVILRDGTNYLEKKGLELPVEFDELVEKAINDYGMEVQEEERKKYWQSKGLIHIFINGVTNCETEYYIPSKDEYRRINILLSQDQESGHVHAFFICSSITVQRRKEAESRKALVEAFESANRANNAKSDFLSKMSHDIRTPMNAIIGMTAIAATHIEDKERVYDSLNKIDAASKHLLGLINEVLDMSKIESGKMSLNSEEFNLSELINSLIIMMQPQAKEHKHELKVRVNRLEHEKVIGDSLRLQQCFVNIMGNAVKYTPDGGRIELYVTEKESKKANIGCYEFVFKDNGNGMSEEYVEHIFEPFTREEDDRTSKIQGTGLGMTITKNIVTMMDGEIDVQSELGKGSTFTVTIYLKLQKVEEADLAELQGKDILVVDDDEKACESVCSMINDLGMESCGVTSGEAAIEKVREFKEAGKAFYAIILDWKMPKLNGVETARAIKEIIGDETGITILSAYDWSEIETEARDAGIDSFISKPVFKSGLVNMFKENRGEQRPLNKSEAIDEIANFDYANKRALIVEDNELNMEIALEIFGMAGLMLETAENGEEALNKYKEHEADYYDIIFMDIQMPVMNGYEATKAIRGLDREDAKTIPIIAMTANAFAEDIRDSQHAGMNEHLAKPIDFAQLTDVLRKYLE